MASNYVQEGCVLPLIAPYTRTSGQGALVGSIFGIALVDITSGATGSFSVDDVWAIDKVSAQAWTVGERIYWDDSAKLCTSSSGGNTLIGVAVVAAANPSATGSVRLNGVF
jgi:predicted RecA/RadA family phage recombinase